MAKNWQENSVYKRPANNGKSHISPIKSIIAALALFLLIKLFAFDALVVEGHSMEPSLPPGRLIFVNRLAYGFLLPFVDKYLVTWATPTRNSIIIMSSPMDSSKIIKRCIALPGDRIFLENGTLLIDSGESVRIELENAPFFLRSGDTTVPKNNFLVLGDNLADSVDSRLFGFVPLERISGTIFF